MELHYARLLFTFTLTSDLPDPHAFFATRAEFETAFRNSLGCRRSDCTGCLLAPTCPFPATFGQQIAKDPEAVRRHQKPPLPFIFQFPLLPFPPNRGKSFQLALHLVGSAVQHVADYINAVRVLVESKKGCVVKVEAEAPGGGTTPIDAAGIPLLSSQDPVLAGPLSTETVTLQLLTPLKLVHEGRLLKNFNFAQFARSLMRRISSLAYHYEGAEPSLDYRWLSQSSEAVETLEYSCSVVSWNGRPAGITGSAVFGGDMEPFHLLLQLGMATHLGKGASFGFGSYRVES